MTNVPLDKAMLLWNSGLNGGTPACVVRPLGHDDYYRYGSQVGACFTDFRKLDERGQKLQIMIEARAHAAVYTRALW